MNYWSHSPPSAQKHRLSNYLLNLLSNLYIETKNEQKALEILTIEINTINSFHNIETQDSMVEKAYYYSGIGLCHIKFSHYEEAKDYFLKAIEILEKISLKGEKKYIDDLVKCYNNLAICMFFLSPNKSLFYFDKVMKIYLEAYSKNENKYHSLLCLLFINNGVFFYRNKIFDKAYDFFSKALSLSENLFKSNPTVFNSLYARNLYYSSTALINLKKYDGVEKKLLLAIDIQETLSCFNLKQYGNDLIESYVLAAIFYSKQSEKEKASFLALKVANLSELLFKNNTPENIAVLGKAGQIVSSDFVDNSSINWENNYTAACLKYESKFLSGDASFLQKLVISYYFYFSLKNDKSLKHKTLHYAFVRPLDFLNKTIIDELLTSNTEEKIIHRYFCDVLSAYKKFKYISKEKYDIQHIIEALTKTDNLFKNYNIPIGYVIDYMGILKDLYNLLYEDLANDFFLNELSVSFERVGLYFANIGSEYYKEAEYSLLICYNIRKKLLSVSKKSSYIKNMISITYNLGNVLNLFEEEKYADESYKKFSESLSLSLEYAKNSNYIEPYDLIIKNLYNLLSHRKLKSKDKRDYCNMLSFYSYNLYSLTKKPEYYELLEFAISKSDENI